MAIIPQAARWTIQPFLSRVWCGYRPHTLMSDLMMMHFWLQCLAGGVLNM